MTALRIGGRGLQRPNHHRPPKAELKWDGLLHGGFLICVNSCPAFRVRWLLGVDIHMAGYKTAYFNSLTIYLSWDRLRRIHPLDPYFSRSGHMMFLLVSWRLIVRKNWIPLYGEKTKWKFSRFVNPTSFSFKKIFFLLHARVFHFNSQVHPLLVEFTPFPLTLCEAVSPEH